MSCSRNNSCVQLQIKSIEYYDWFGGWGDPTNTDDRLDKMDFSLIHVSFEDF